MPSEDNGHGLYFLPSSEYKLEHRLLDVTREASETLVRVAELQHLRPAEEATKQEIERTKQTRTIARHQTLRAAFAPVLVAVSVWAACNYPKAAAVITVIVGISLVPSIIEKIRKPHD